MHTLANITSTSQNAATAALPANGRPARECGRGGVGWGGKARKKVGEREGEGCVCVCVCVFMCGVFGGRVRERGE